MKPDYNELFTETRNIAEKLLKDNSGTKLQCFVDFIEIDRLIKAVTPIITNSDGPHYFDAPDELRDAFKEFKKFMDAEELYAVYIKTARWNFLQTKRSRNTKLIRLRGIMIRQWP